MRLSLQSAFVTHSPGTTSPIYQCWPFLLQFGHLHLITPSGHGSKMEAFRWGNTETGHICILVSTCRIAGREKGQASYGAGPKAGLGGHQAGLPRWPTPLLGDWARECGHLIQELGAGAIRGRPLTHLGES